MSSLLGKQLPHLIGTLCSASPSVSWQKFPLPGCFTVTLYARPQWLRAPFLLIYSMVIWPANCLSHIIAWRNKPTKSIERCQHEDIFSLSAFFLFSFFGQRPRSRWRHPGEIRWIPTANLCRMPLCVSVLNAKTPARHLHLSNKQGFEVKGLALGNYRLIILAARVTQSSNKISLIETNKTVEFSTLFWKKRLQDSHRRNGYQRNSHTSKEMIRYSLSPVDSIPTQCHAGRPVEKNNRNGSGSHSGTRGRRRANRCRR